MLSAVTIKMLPVCPVFPILAAAFAVTPNMLPVYPACVILATLLAITPSMLPVYPAYLILVDPCMHMMAGSNPDRGVGAV